MAKKYLFDENFYAEFYKDVNIKDKESAIKHYRDFGFNESRISCEEELNDILNKNLSTIKKQNELLNKTNFKKPENKLNILIRTSMRPEFFNECIKSVLNQNYSNYHVYVCYDKKECLNYLYDYSLNNKSITIFYINNDSNKKYKFNLYNNILKGFVSDGFIIYLDDDDVFTNNNCFKVINENIRNDNNILIWKFMKPDKLIYPKDINNIKIGEIDTTSICFHSKFKNVAKWIDEQCGDYHFYTELFSKLKEMNQFNIIKVNYILTKTIYHNKFCGSI